MVECQHGWLAKIFIFGIEDNVQVLVQNIHVRLEFNNSHLLNDSFSMGATLEQLKINTTNEDWQVEFTDRKQLVQARKPLYKILIIQNFGLYCKPEDKYFISDMESEEQRTSLLRQLFPVGQSKIT